MMRLRAHHFLCLLGFRGLGYSPAFVARLTAVSEHLSRSPETLVTAVAGADVVCAACPNRAADGNDCGNGPGPRTKDNAVLARLGASPEELHPWSEWQRRVAAALDAEALAAVCAGCQWFSLGYCREGLEALRRRYPPQAE